MSFSDEELITADNEKLQSVFSELEDKFLSISMNGAYVEKTAEGTLIYGNPVQAANVGIDFNNLPDVIIFKNALIWEADIPLNGLIYPDSVLKDNYMSLDKIPITPGHVDTISNEFGIVRNPTYIGKKLYADLVITNKQFAANILKGRKLGLSPTQWYQKNWKDPITVDYLKFKSLSPVDTPAYDKTFLNNSKMSEVENIMYDPKKLMDYTIEELRAIVKQLSAELKKYEKPEGYPSPEGYPKTKGEELEQQVEDIKNQLKNKMPEKPEVNPQMEQLKNELLDERKKSEELRLSLIADKVDVITSAQKRFGIIENEESAKAELMKKSPEVIFALVENTNKWLAAIKKIVEKEIPAPNISVNQGVITNSKHPSVEEQITAIISGR